MPRRPGLARFYDLLFPLRPQVVRFVAGLLGRPGRRVLDIGCGTGALAAALAAHGHRVTGIDSDPGMIEEARRRHEDVEFLHRDMRDIGRLDGPFDLVYALGNVLSFLEDAHLGGVLDALGQRLAADGAWVFQVVDWDRILTRLPYRFPVKEIRAQDLEFYREYRAAARGVLFRTRLLRGGILLADETVTLHPRGRDVTVRTHADHGFVLRDHCGDYDGRPYEEGGPASIYLFARSGK